jgi:hypothetical protein
VENAYGRTENEPYWNHLYNRATEYTKYQKRSPVDPLLLGKWRAKLWEASREREVWLDEGARDVLADEPRKSTQERGKWPLYARGKVKKRQ